jgi:TRAP-type C4-dicarboxylate transport system substrate-binding protein
MQERNIIAVIGAAAMSVGMVAPLWAQESITLKLSDWLPESHYTVSQAARPFMEKARELSDGRIDFQYFPGEQLGKAKDALTLAQTGVADIVNISPAYIPDKFILSSVAELPGMFKSACQGSYAIKKLVEDGGIIDKEEYAPQGVRVLLSIAYFPYQVGTTDRVIDEVSDFAGLKLRTAGSAMDMTATQLGAISVRMPGPDILPSMSRGTLDGGLFPLQSVRVFDLQTVLKHMTTDVSMGSFVLLYAISDRAWNSLDEDLQRALTEAGDYATQHHCEYVDANEPEETAKLEADGMVGNTMAEGELEKLQIELSKVQQAWAKQLDDNGRRGSDVLKEFLAVVDQE